MFSFRIQRWGTRLWGNAMATVDFAAFDADNHYYEAIDAFTRHLPAHRSKLVTWATINGKPRLVIDNKVFRFIPNPTFDPVAKPGVLDEYFRGRSAGDSIRDAFGDLEPINPAYRALSPELQAFLYVRAFVVLRMIVTALGLGIGVFVGQLFGIAAIAVLLVLSKTAVAVFLEVGAMVDADDEAKRRAVRP